MTIWNIKKKVSGFFVKSTESTWIPVSQCTKVKKETQLWGWHAAVTVLHSWRKTQSGWHCSHRIYTSVSNHHSKTAKEPFYNVAPFSPSLFQESSKLLLNVVKSVHSHVVCLALFPSLFTLGWGQRRRAWQDLRLKLLLVGQNKKKKLKCSHTHLFSIWVLAVPNLLL